MHKYSDHKHFEQKSKWTISEFLDNCDLEPLERKIHCYINCLETIVATTEDDSKRNQAKQLLQKYRSVSEEVFVKNVVAHRSLRFVSHKAIFGIQITY